MNTIFQSVLVCLDKGIESTSANFEEDTLTTALVRTGSHVLMKSEGAFTRNLNLPLFI